MISHIYGLGKLRELRQLGYQSGTYSVQCVSEMVVDKYGPNRDNAKPDQQEGSDEAALSASSAQESIQKSFSQRSANSQSDEPAYRPDVDCKEEEETSSLSILSSSQSDADKEYTGVSISQLMQQAKVDKAKLENKISNGDFGVFADPSVIKNITSQFK